MRECLSVFAWDYIGMRARRRTDTCEHPKSERSGER